NYANDAPKIPAGAVPAEDADLITNLIQQGPVKMKLVLTPQTLPDVESANVIADIKGSEHPEQMVIVSGHLDSWDLGTGAIDDGAGVAVSIEAANLIQKLHLKPKRTIRVIAWMNEENGEAGSKQYAKDHEKQISNHFAAMETDGGAGHPIGVNIKANGEVKKMFALVANIFSPIQDSRFYFNYHHTAADTLDKIVPKELAENSAVVAVMAYALANMERPLPR
ncbi:MAG: peptidase M28 family protein, partial [Verrucomicrobia bacterium]